MRTICVLALILLCHVSHADESSSSSSASSSPQVDEKAERRAAKEQARRYKVSAKRFAVCMRQTLGRFADFKSSAEHQRAAELCQKFANQ